MKKNKREIEVSLKRRIVKSIHASIPPALYEVLFREAVNRALSGDREAAQWFIDELIIRERESRHGEYESMRTNGEIGKLFYGRPCVACGKPADTIDHKIPLSKGGSNDMDNLQPMCWKCNRKKSDRE